MFKLLETTSTSWECKHRLACLGYLQMVPSLKDKVLQVNPQYHPGASATRFELNITPLYFFAFVFGALT